MEMVTREDVAGLNDVMKNFFQTFIIILFLLSVLKLGNTKKKREQFFGFFLSEITLLDN